METIKTNYEIKYYNQDGTCKISKERLIANIQQEKVRLTIAYFNIMLQVSNDKVAYAERDQIEVKTKLSINIKSNENVLKIMKKEYKYQFNTNIPNL